jgi:hypothetical protein
MAKEKLEDLSIEQLKKKKKFVSVLIGVCIGIFLANIAVTMILIVQNGRLDTIGIANLTSGFVLIMIAGFMFLGGKKIDEELARRNDK